MVFIEKKRTKFLGLPICFSTYSINEDKINIKCGFLSIVEDDAFMYKIQDARLNKSLMERIFKLGTITCYTGDTTHPELKLIHIKNSGKIKDYIMQASEEARRKRRTLHSLDIDVNEMDVDDLGIN
jgi:uncharacterized membrane protein YdbT with pleckstrin-like domain